MSAPNYRKQKSGWATLEGLFRDAANGSVIHYSCESFYDRPNGASPRITSIAVRKLDSAQTVVVLDPSNRRTAWRRVRSD